MKATAYCLIREAVHYRRNAFDYGLRKAGYNVVFAPCEAPRPDDVLVIWNRYGTGAVQAAKFEAVGATVLVCENGYMGADDQGRQYYAIARRGHNGSGTWPGRTLTDEARFPKLGITIEPWRDATDAGHILVREQRGIGPPDMASPANWHNQMADALRARFKREVRIRPHPAREPDGYQSLAEDLANCHCVVSWASSIVGHALVRGVPAVVFAPHHVLYSVCGHGFGDIENPPRFMREGALERMAWAQWSVAEIEKGIPFDLLL